MGPGAAQIDPFDKANTGRFSGVSRVFRNCENHLNFRLKQNSMAPVEGIRPLYFSAMERVYAFYRPKSGELRRDQTYLGLHIRSHNLRIEGEAVMRHSGRGIAITSLLLVVGCGLWFSAAPSLGQTATTTYRAPRTADGKPNLNGIWQALNTAEWDIQPHDAKPGPVVVMGAVGGVPAGLGVVEGGPLPYKPEALAQKKKNEANWLALDPEVRCYLPGIPRATYMPFPFQIVQSPQ
jgi:hypothetical protein